MEAGVERMTDREKLRNLIGRVQDEGVSYVDCFSDDDKPDYISNYELADYLIANCVTFATDTNDGGKWISVEDEKPKRNGWYWCYHLPNSINGNERWETQSLYWEDNLWLYHPGTFKVAQIVTHWMPMPEPPEEEPK